MVTCTLDTSGQPSLLELRPNASPSRNTVVGAFVVACVPIVAQAVILTLLGLWPVLFYAAATLVALGAGLRIGYRYTQQRELVLLCGDRLAVEKGHHRLEERHEFPSAWAQVVTDVVDGQVRHLFVRSHGREVEVGRFLDEPERRETALRLRLLLARAHGGETPPEPTDCS
jgi:uncharacterized membrane protein